MKILLRNLAPHPIPRPLISSSDVWGKEICLNSGQSVQVVAKSGKGKSTLLHLIYGLRSDYEGGCDIDGSCIKIFTEKNWSEMRSARISLLFQDLRLFQKLTARENLELLPVVDSAPYSIEDMCERLEVSHLLHRTVSTLSLGQRQRFALIRSLRKPFSWLLLDEPFSHLDDEAALAAARLIEEFIQLKKAGLILSSLHEGGPLTCKMTLQL